ncbi:MAG: hypothetical protein SF123_17860 [Chloroflexota bacterium]|nr:hypothetical protein [Chloroflexota bacterium]
MPSGTFLWGFRDALHNDYTSPPDFNLLLLVGSILIEPIDWVVTGVDVIGDLARGDFGSAAANTALAVLPIAGGWMDDLGDLRYAPDDPPGGGGVPGNSLLPNSSSGTQVHSYGQVSWSTPSLME